MEECRSKGSRKSAVFFADKACTLSNNEEVDLFSLCRVLHENGEHMRAIHILRGGMVSASTIKDSWRHWDASRLLIGRCLADLDLWEECLEELGDGDLEDTSVYNEFDDADHGAEVSYSSSLSSLGLLRGRAHAALQNVSRATRCYVASLKADPTCVEAFSALVDGKLLTLEEQVSLLASLEFLPEDSWLKDLYELRVAPEQAVAERSAQQETPTTDFETKFTPRGGHAGARRDLSGNRDFLCVKARGYEQAGSHASALSITTHLLDRDPYDLAPAETHIASLVALGRQNELFLSAHRLIEAHPEKAIAWYAVGCYYLVAGQSDRARVYFSRATHQHDGHECAAAWLAFGHSFAVQDESDQAMAAYRTASRMFPGYFLPQLCMGMEYARTNNLSLARQYFTYAENMSPSNPVVQNEAGTLQFRNGNYAQALGHFQRALSLYEGQEATLPFRKGGRGPAAVEGGMAAGYETALVNLAHCHRKLGRYAEAAAYLEEALGVNAACASTHSALAFTQHCLGDIHHAIEGYHRALGLRADDSFAAEMLGRALRDCARLSFAVGRPSHTQQQQQHA